MAKQLSVNLTFTADITKAKQQLDTLQNHLTRLVNTKNLDSVGTKFNKEMDQSILKVAELQQHLKKATNESGLLDFDKLNRSFRESGSSIGDFAKSLRNMGADGAKAYTMLAQAISSAEVPVKRTTALMDDLWRTMKNTAKWQLSSSVMHAFIGSVQSAVNYVKNLDQSLNNIRIVTGNSAEQMASFAKEANKAAKALNTTTVRYTDASLIYFQQGE